MNSAILNLYDQLVAARNVVDIYTICLPRRYGKTTLAHKIATQMFDSNKKIATVHTSVCAMMNFQTMGGIFHSQTHTLGLEQYDVIIIDNAEHILNERESFCKNLKRNGCSVYLIGSDIPTLHMGPTWALVDQ